MSTYRKKLIEVALPLTAINIASGAEKLIHVGTTSNLHAWWAPRPLAACRAVIFASVIDDPGEYLPPAEAQAERRRLFDLIERLVQWNANTDEAVLAEARSELQKHLGGQALTVIDPFSGRGTIPVEALRLGLDAVGLDLNPVAIAISKALVEVPSIVAGKAARVGTSKSAHGLDGFRSDLEYFTRLVGEKVAARVQALYARSYRDGEQPLAWLWSRTADCPNPGCNARVPLVSSMWLSKSPQARAWLRFAGCTTSGRVSFVVGSNAEGEAPPPTLTDSGAICPVCRTPIPFAALRDQGRSGKLGLQLNVVVTRTGRSMIFRIATEEEERVALAAVPDWAPETSLPDAALGFRVQNYGLTTHRSLYLDRQLKMLGYYADAIDEVIQEATSISKPDTQYKNAVALYLALFFDRMVQTNNALVRWFTRVSGPSKAQPTFDKQTVQMVWDFAEAYPLADSTGGWTTCCKYPMTALDCLPLKPGRGSVFQGDSSLLTLPRETVGPVMFCTDPPYFDNIGYADLSDFFYVWLRRVLRNVYPDAFRTITVPKDDEIMGVDPAVPQSYFDTAIAKGVVGIRLNSLEESVYEQSHDNADDDWGTRTGTA